MANDKLHKAKEAKNDEFYTLFHDIESEINAYLEFNPDVFRGKTVLLPCDDPETSNFTRYFVLNFESLGLKKLVSTSYAYISKRLASPFQLSLFERESEQFDQTKTKTHGKIFVLTGDKNHDGKINVDDLDWRYLKGDGDFRSEEVTKLRDEADIIVTNPPFSLFRECWDWITSANKKFLMIANKNCITYKEVFPLIKANKAWSGKRSWTGGMWFETIDSSNVDLIEGGRPLKNVPSFWLTNIDHGRRHTPLSLMTKADNLRYSKHKALRGKPDYDHYDNYEAIEVPHVDAIPSDYEGVMGVPITFLGQYCPEQFRILGATESEGKGFSCGLWKAESGIAQATINGEKVYKRLFIQKL